MKSRIALTIFLSLLILSLAGTALAAPKSATGKSPAPSAKTASSASSAELAWREKQEGVIQTVLHLARIGTRYPAFRCGLYVPGYGACYMKVTGVKNEESDSKTGGVSGTYVADVAEVLEVSKALSRNKALGKGETAALQSRFMNTTFLRLLSKDLVADLSVTSMKNTMALKKLLEDIVTYSDGSYKDKKVDVWVSPATESFTKGSLPLSRIAGEGMIIPDKYIVIYQKFPGLWKSKGEKALADKLYEALKEAKSLTKYYSKYQIAVGVESGTQLLFATYPLEKLATLKRDEFKYFRYSDR